MFVPESLLKRHVQHSNAIEGILKNAGPYVSSHMAAARLATKKTWPYHPVHPDALHRALAQGTEMSPFAGKWRTGRMYVRGNLPRPHGFFRRKIFFLRLDIDRFDDRLSRMPKMQWLRRILRPLRPKELNECPKPQHVPMLMAWWWGHVRQYAGDPRSKAGDYAEALHDLLLCIHPYPDGNGRTARLFLNSLRMSRGLPWQAADVTYKLIYYGRIRRMQKAFKKMFPDVY